MTRLSWLVLATDESSGQPLARRIEALPNCRVEAVTTEAEDLGEAVTESRPDALLAHLGDSPGLVLDAIEWLPEPRPALLACGPADDAQVVLRAMRLGAVEFLSKEPDGEDLRVAVERLARSGGRANSSSRPGAAPIVAVLGAKGGVGATLVASQLGLALQGMGRRTVLLDLVLPQGDVALHLDLEPAYGLVGAASEVADLDASVLQSLLCSHRSGLQMLPATQSAEEAELLRGSWVERTLELLRADFDWVVVDLGRNWGEGSIRALDLADQVLLLTECDLPSLVNAHRQLDLLERLGVAERRIHVIENRHGQRQALSARDARRYLGRSLEARLPDDPPAAMTTVNDGRTLAEVGGRSRLERGLKALARMAHGWAGQEVPGATRASWLKRLPGGFGRSDHGTA
jgi:pilus assembly protein CpaE